MKKILYLFVFLFSLLFLNYKVLAWSEYKIGDIVPINEMDFYVIKDSGSNEDSVSLLKKEPLSVDEVNKYGKGHINNYAGFTPDNPSYQKAYDIHGYGIIQYYSSETCGMIDPFNAQFENCKNDYASSDIKYVVDAWANDNFQDGLKEARLITIEEIKSIVEFEEYRPCGDNCNTILERIGEKTNWLYNKDYCYWTMSPYENSKTNVWRVTNYGTLYNYFVGKVPTGSDANAVRPVITISKTALGDKNESKKEEKINNNESNNNINNIEDNNKTSINVKVDNTYLSQSLLIILIGFIIVCVSLTLYYIIRKRKKE